MILEGLVFKGLSILTHTYVLISEASQHPRVSETFNQIDLEADLRIAASIVKYVIENYQSSLKDVNGPLVLRLKQVDEMTQSINLELTHLKEEMAEHNEKYFSSWRTPSYESSSLPRLVAHKKTLDHRIMSLIDLIKVFKNNRPPSAC